MRWLRRSLLAASFLLLLIALFGWIRSLNLLDSISYSSSRPSGSVYTTRNYQLDSARGVVGFSIYRIDGLPGAPGARDDSGWTVAHQSAARFVLPDDTRWRRLRFGFIQSGPDRVRGVEGTTVSSTSWWVPHWFLAAVLAMPLALWLVIARPLRARRRRALRQCVQCGYDLRASAGRCPECGAAFGSGDGGNG